MVIERYIVDAVNRARPGSRQEGLAKELEATFRSVRERGFNDIPTEDTNKVYSYNGFTYYPGKVLIELKNGEWVSLTPTENEILKFLAVNSGNVVTRERISEVVWGNREEAELPKKYIQRLRGKFTKNGGDKNDFICTKHGVGYCLPSLKPVVLLDKTHST